MVSVYRLSGAASSLASPCCPSLTSKSVECVFGSTQHGLCLCTPFWICSTALGLTSLGSSKESRAESSSPHKAVLDGKETLPCEKDDL